MSPPVLPTACPRCQKTLYPIATLRPHPRDSAFTRLGFLLGGLVSASIFLCGGFWLRERFSYTTPTADPEVVMVTHPPTKLIALVMLIPALTPGFLIGWLSSRSNQVVKLRCSSCGWGEKYQLPRKSVSRLTARKEPGPSMVGIGAARIAPEPPRAPVASVTRSATTESASPFDQIVDDGDAHKELNAWIYAELIRGRSPEAISADLQAQGWAADDVEGWVEKGRKATRHRRA